MGLEHLDSVLSYLHFNEKIEKPNAYVYEQIENSIYDASEVLFNDYLVEFEEVSSIDGYSLQKIAYPVYRDGKYNLDEEVKLMLKGIPKEYQDEFIGYVETFKIIQSLKEDDIEKMAEKIINDFYDSIVYNNIEELEYLVEGFLYNSDKEWGQEILQYVQHELLNK